MPQEHQLATLKSALDLAPSAIELDDLFPLFVPAAFVEGGQWPGPFESTSIDGLALTWAVELENQSMLYVNHSTATHWENSGIDWKARAMDNLNARSEQQFCTSVFPRQDGVPFALVFMHDDGYGPSRLLRVDELRRHFPEGYEIALPEMSCGFALSLNATSRERAKIDGVVKRCFTAGTRPLVPGIHPAAGLTLRRQ